jgi:tagatose-6-phosphate ketose/aldose isomerase
MLLTGLLISRLSAIQELKKQVERLAVYAENLLENYVSKLKDVAELDFKRAVFLGSGPLLGTARESQLKLQELTDGKVICKYDSFLGFRHGPKVVIDSSTLIVFLFSNNEYVRQYEVDLVNAINAGEKGLYSIGIFESCSKGFDLDLKICHSEGGEPIDEEFLSVCSVLPAQILGFFKSLQLGLEPDAPSVNGTITRVVEGVIIYPYTAGSKTVEYKLS